LCRSGEPFLQGSRQKRKALLAAELNKATKARSRSAIAANPLKRKPQQAPVQQTGISKQVNESSNKAADVSFAPSFLASSIQQQAQQPQDDAVEAVENSDNLVMQQSLPWMSPPQPQRGWMASPVPRKTKQPAGPLMKRLKSIRTAMGGDAIRLQSGQYPFSARSLDRNDPRNRATTVCNVTILGNPIAWGGDEKGSAGRSTGNSKHHHSTKQHRLVTALSYVHSWTTPGVVAAIDSTTSTGTNEMTGLVWAVFTHEKAREQSLGKGTELRIYNAVSVPFLSQNSATSLAKRMLLCTNLCEPYPSSVLPPLSNVSTITEGMDSLP